MADFHISIMHAPYLPPKILHNHCFQFLLGRLQYPGEMKTKVMQNLRGQIRCIMGNVEGRILHFFLKKLVCIRLHDYARFR